MFVMTGKNAKFTGYFLILFSKLFNLSLYSLVFPCIHLFVKHFVMSCYGLIFTLL